MKKRTDKLFYPLVAVASVNLATHIYDLALRGRLLNWGATAAEISTALPGDRVVHRANYQTTRAISIASPVSSVWQWVVQIGQNRGGFYSYDWIENLGGLRIQSANEIIPELQKLRAGDVVKISPQAGMIVTMIKRNEFLVVRSLSDLMTMRLPDPNNPSYFDWSWSIVLRQLNEQSTRLIVRVRAATKDSLLRSFLGPTAWEPLHFLMERKMLLGIKQRAESMNLPA